MTAKVVDASVLAAISFREPDFTDAVRMLAGHDLHAPVLLRFEMANVCQKKIRLQPTQRDLLIEQHGQSLGVYIRQHRIEPSGVLAMADKLKLSAYDASYLWLAQALGIALLTLDDRLQKAAAKL